MFGVESDGVSQLELEHKGCDEIVEIQIELSRNFVVRLGYRGNFIEANMAFLDGWKEESLGSFYKSFSLLVGEVEDLHFGSKLNARGWSQLRLDCWEICFPECDGFRKGRVFTRPVPRSVCI